MPRSRSPAILSRAMRRHLPALVVVLALLAACAPAEGFEPTSPPRPSAAALAVSPPSATPTADRDLGADSARDPDPDPGFNRDIDAPSRPPPQAEAVRDQPGEHGRLRPAVHVRLVRGGEHHDGPLDHHRQPQRVAFLTAAAVGAGPRPDDRQPVRWRESRGLDGGAQRAGPRRLPAGQPADLRRGRGPGGARPRGDEAAGRARHVGRPARLGHDRVQGDRRSAASTRTRG